ncbi:MAG: asparaginase domain-containing protein [Planctomycetota bacterium]|nr:asparaginase domain-containing protein [Planctomycetota bacterium]
MQPATTRMTTKKRIAIISTGGTIEKTYDEFAGVLNNHTNVLDVVLATLQLDGTELVRVPLLNKDSLDMTESDHDLIAQTVASMTSAHDGVIVVHGTDKLSISGERIYDLVTNPRVPIVLTGAMRPYVMRNTDAVQNLTEALLAVQLLAPGVYVAMHNRVLQFPGVLKDRDRGTFAKP